MSEPALSDDGVERELIRQPKGKPRVAAGWPGSDTGEPAGRTLNGTTIVETIVVPDRLLDFVLRDQPT